MSYPFLNLHPTTPLLYSPSEPGIPPSKKTTEERLKPEGGAPSNAEPRLTLSPHTKSTGTIHDFARHVITPFDVGFMLDPLKLSAATPFLSPVLRVPGPIRYKEFRVADFESTGVELPDRYPELLSRIPNVRLVRVLPVEFVVEKEDCGRGTELNAQRIRADGRADQIQPLISTSLRIASGSVDMVTARSLHKTFRLGRQARASDIERTLAECFRILRQGGILEYIFFERRLSNAGPRAKELEEIWNVDVDGALSISHFMAALDQAGFIGGQHLRTIFGLVTLNRLFDEHGRRRGKGIRAQVGLMGLGMGSTSSPGAEGLGELQKECEEGGTGWRCVIGWCIKP
ncbi:hypothetical protein ASPCAL03473 [Aspergillus calidoustus]|uniref:Uncharacterized protein n=1 Tax=Aspergillus calidoustus TaxID=454130 RepID=A0A0U5FVE3_ASPCI|nr:hypothetical protein ASPCAL03473 [Aspergillus calidoustus]